MSARPAGEPSPVNPGNAPRPEQGAIRIENSPRDSAGNPARDFTTESSIGGATVRVPVNAVYLVVTGLVVLVVIAFAVGSVLARRDAERKSSSERTQPPIVEPADQPAGVEGTRTADGATPRPNAVDPDRTPIGTNTKGVSKDVRGPSDAGESATEKAGVVAAAALSSAGWLAADPRESGLNYLVLAYVNRTEAESAVTFLAQNGLETFALYVDPSQVRANNFDPTRPYKLYVSKGITSDEYSKKMTAKTNVEAAAARLGLRWQKELKGSSNFSRPSWEKK
jgi:hypothetical protein